MSKQARNDDYTKQIENYANQIETIDSFIEAVRRFPGMYIGSKGNIGWKACIREIFQNSVDEAIRKDSPCNTVKVTFDERTQGVVIEDDGRGIPLGHIVRIYTSAHTSSNYTKKKYEYTSGVHGVGGGVALALSKEFEITSYVLGVAHKASFVSGKIMGNDEVEVPCPKGRQGTTISMYPDMSVLDHVHLTCEDVLDLVIMIYPLMNIGNEVDFYGIDAQGKPKYAEHFVNKDGIITHLYMTCKNPLVNPIHYAMDNGDMRAEVVLDYDVNDLSNDISVVSFSNFTPTPEHGTHVQGFIEGFCSFFRNYMNKIYLNDKSKITIINSDIRTGLKVVINAAHLNPVFAGQFKGMLSNEDMKGFVKDLTINSLEQWSKTNTGDLQKICRFIKDIASIRAKAEGEKIKISGKFQTNRLTGKPKKYCQPSSNKGKQELIIVEGDSALGSAKNGRDCTVQGIFPIRGKLPNAFNTPRAKFLANEEVASIITLVGGGYGRNFDIDAVKWDKIIMMCDADADGSHINTLLLRLFLLYMPEVIEAGKLYRAVPPLYGVRNGKKTRYFTSTMEYTQYAQKLFSNKHELKYFNSGIRLSSTEVVSLFMKNKDYKDLLEVTGSTNAVNPKLLEDILFYYDQYIVFSSFAGQARRDKPNDAIALGDAMSMRVDYSLSNTINPKAFQGYLRKAGHRFINVIVDNGTIVIHGLDNGAYQDVFMNDRFIQACMPMIKLIKSNDYHQYVLDGEVHSIYEIMTIFEAIQPSYDRYKGLGEQNAKQLGESALRPDSDRTLIRYTMHSAKEEINLIRTIDSNRAVLLKNINISKEDVE